MIDIQSKNSYLDKRAVQFPNFLNQFILDCIHGHGEAVLPIDYVIENRGDGI